MPAPIKFRSLRQPIPYKKKIKGTSFYEVIWKIRKLKKGDGE